MCGVHEELYKAYRFGKLLPCHKEDVRYIAPNASVLLNRNPYIVQMALFGGGVLQNSYNRCSFFPSAILRFVSKYLQ